MFPFEIEQTVNNEGLSPESKPKTQSQVSPKNERKYFENNCKARKENDRVMNPLEMVPKVSSRWSPACPDCNDPNYVQNNCHQIHDNDLKGIFALGVNLVRCWECGPGWLRPRWRSSNKEEKEPGCSQCEPGSWRQKGTERLIFKEKKG